MDKFWWHAAWGLCLLPLSLAQQQIDLNITCRYAGVFHVEKNGRYSISRTEAADLCQAFNSTLPTMEQMQKALHKGFETCRYGFIEGQVVIPRIHPNAICAANHTGVYVLTSNASHYDTYCFNASAPLEEDCTSVTDLPNSFEGPVTITIVNRDGTRYSKKGEYRTHPEDINATSTIDDDVSSGSSSEKSTSDGYVFHTNLPTVHSTGDQDDPYFIRSTPATIASTVHSNSHAAAQKQNNWIWFWFGNSQSTTQTQEPTTTATTALMTTPETPPKRQEAQNWFSWFFQPPESKSHLHTTTKMPGTESNTNPTGWEPNEENEDETDKYPSFSGSGIDDDEDFISSTNTDASHSTTFRPTTAPNTHLVEDLDRTGPLSVTTPQSHSQDFFTSHGEMEEEKYHSTTSVLPSSTRSGGRRGPSLPKDATTSLEGYTSHYPDTMENGTLTLVTPAKTGVFGETEATVAADSDFNVDGSLPEDQDSFVDPSGNPHTVTELAGHSSGSQDGGVNTTSSPGRKPQIPDWLIILASLLALALILAVCIAVNSRRRCGQKKKLVINSGNGKVEDRKPSELNGEASKSQEMVHLVNKEPSETPDQFMTADETRNLQNVDMKIGV
ncbi:CD44 antigen isoform X6 [Cricetulus griseus]|uniref:CD44 antigen isoform X6 n=1 Tax=Cricetulus griseus TaxID=10029 RepID=UPI0007DAB1C6|nr:CD44 antigen isoform X6 [Cricetulus griseus]